MARKLEVEIIGDSRDYERALKRSADGTSKFGGALGGLAKGAAFVAGGAALGGLFAVVKNGVGEFTEATRVSAQTNAVIKATGGVANVTSKQVAALAGEIQGYSGADDEAIQKGANLLLTFKNVRNEAGAGADVFDRATKSAVDLSVAGFGSIDSASKMLGKALNDPLKGLSALGRAGVTFSEQQKELIKDLVATGDTLGAQKIILAEVESQVGGSAKAYGDTLPGQLSKAREAFNNLAGGLVAAVAPAFTEAATWAAEKLPAAFNTLGAAIDGLVSGESGKFPGLASGVTSAFNTAKEVGDAVWPHVKRIIKGVSDFINDNVLPVLGKLGTIAKNTWEGIAKVLQDNEAEINRIIGAVGAILNTLGTTLLWLANTVVIPVIKPLFEHVLPVALNLTIDALNLLVAAGEGVKTGLVWLRDHGEKAVTAFTGAASGPLDTVRKVMGAISVSIQKIVDGIQWLGNHAGSVFEKVGGALGKVASVVGDVAAGVNSAQAAAMRPSYAAGAGGLAPQTASLLGTIQSQFGNVLVTSGFRTRAENERVGGAPNSDHLTGRAFDLVPASGWNPATVALFDRIAAFAANLSSVRWIGWRGVPNHGPYNHLHISTYDQGGWLMPGLTLARNDTGRPERILPPGDSRDVHIHINGVVGMTKEDLAVAVRDSLNRVGVRNNGSGIFIP